MQHFYVSEQNEIVAMKYGGLPFLALHHKNRQTLILPGLPLEVAYSFQTRRKAVKRNGRLGFLFAVGLPSFSRVGRDKPKVEDS